MPLFSPLRSLSGWLGLAGRMLQERWHVTSEIIPQISLPPFLSLSDNFPSESQLPCCCILLAALLIDPHDEELKPSTNSHAGDFAISALTPVKLSDD